MKHLIITLILSIGIAQCYSQSKEWAASHVAVGDSIAYRTMFYFKLNEGKSITESEYKKMSQLLDWAKVNNSIPITIVGRTDKSGELAYNQRLSLRRAKFIRNLLIRNGIDSLRISATGGGIGSAKLIDQWARHADVYAIVQVEIEKKNESIAGATSKPEKTTSDENISSQDTLPKIDVTITERPIIERAQPTISPWYIGIGGGIALGRGTFCSFAEGKTHYGFNINTIGGYKISPLFSIEASLDYTRLDLSAYDCCHNLYMGSDGNRYFAPVSGKENYAYRDLLSTTNIITLGANLNIDLVGIWCAHSRWSALVSPAIYGAYSHARVKLSDTDVMQKGAFHVGTGASLGLGYKISNRVGIRLTTGIGIYSGIIDALAKEEHRTNYVWKSGICLLFNL